MKCAKIQNFRSKRKSALTRLSSILLVITFHAVTNLVRQAEKRTFLCDNNAVYLLTLSSTFSSDNNAVHLLTLYKWDRIIELQHIARQRNNISAVRKNSVCRRNGGPH